MITYHLQLLALLLLIAFVPGTLAAAPEDEQTGAMSHPMIGEPAPGFMLETIRGDTVSLAKLRGQFVVIHFAATW
jgi:cytochrome oxidase Cu insertion factor (SCO1/SenC/PrrC family)